MIYFDNAATTFYKPPEVIDAVTDCLKNYSFNANRGAAGGKTLAFKILEAREKVAHFFSCETENVTFTSGCNIGRMQAGRTCHIFRYRT
jgi:selenocysteine lyase/cysteine desulfurase